MRQVAEYPLATRVLDLFDGKHVPPPLPDGYAVVTAKSGDSRTAAEKAIYHRFFEAGLCSESSQEEVDFYAPYIDGSVPIAVQNGDDVVGTVRIKIDEWKNLSVDEYYDYRDATAGFLICEYDGFAVKRGEPHPFVVVHLYRRSFEVFMSLRVPCFCGLSEPMVVDLLDATSGSQMQRHPEPCVEHGNIYNLWWHDTGDYVRRCKETRPAFFAWMTENLSQETIDWAFSVEPHRANFDLCRPRK